MTSPYIKIESPDQIRRPKNTQVKLLKGILMRYGYAIVYVPDVATALDFYERAFGFARRFLHESGQYGELDTGTTMLAFSRSNLAETLFPGVHAAEG